MWASPFYKHYAPSALLTSLSQAEKPEAAASTRPSSPEPSAIPASRLFTEVAQQAPTLSTGHPPGGRRRPVRPASPLEVPKKRTTVSTIAWRLLSIAQRHLGSLNSQSLANMLHSMARLQCHDALLVDLLLQRAKPQLQVTTPRNYRQSYNQIKASVR